MTNSSSDHSSKPATDKPTAEELRSQAEATREELGRTVEALAAKADAKARAKQTAAEVKGQARERAGQAKERVGAVAGRVGEKWRDKAPQPVQDAAHQAAGRARGNPKPLLAGGVAVVVLLLLARCRRHQSRHQSRCR
ncbi:DUF3618 domain-containing protein [Streptomyces hypolithicus]